MAVATIKLVNEQFMGEFYFRKDQVATAQKLIEDGGAYRFFPPKIVEGFEGEEVAEELFDLANNPCRQEEREQWYGRGRSISVGDIVNVDGVDYLCMSIGWKAL